MYKMIPMTAEMAWVWVAHFLHDMFQHAFPRLASRGDFSFLDGAWARREETEPQAGLPGWSRG